MLIATLLRTRTDGIAVNVSLILAMDGQTMRYQDENFFGRLITTLEFLAALYGLVALVFASIYAIYRLPLHYRRYHAAPTPSERAYFLCKLGACGTGGYAFFLTVGLFGVDWFSDYWPAVCMLWTDYGGFDEVGHVRSIQGDLGLCILVCPALHWLALLFGKLLVDCDGDEMFFPTS